MTLSFPNAARSYDEAKGRVRFIGHDGLFEVRFFLPVEILAVDLSSRNAGEREYLAAFDRMRKKILEIAQKTYAVSRRDTVTLDPKSFG